MAASIALLEQKLTRWPFLRLILGRFSGKRVLRAFFLIPAACYLVLGGYAWFFSTGLIFQPQPASYTDNRNVIKIVSTNGSRISGMYLPNPDARYTILYSHGNAEDLGDILPWMQDFHRLGYAVFAYDYQGYGTSDGKPNEPNAYDDVTAAYDYLVGRLGTPPGQIISFGHSVGCGPAIDLATRRTLGGLIVESGFTTAFRTITKYPLLPFDKFDNIGKIGSVTVPTLVIHGKADRVVSPDHGVRLFAAANSPKEVLLVEKAGHNDVSSVGGKRYFLTILNFFPPR